MRKLLLALFLFSSQAKSLAQNNIDVLHYKFNISLNDVSDTIKGIAEIKVKALSVTQEIIFDLTSLGSSGKGMKVGRIQSLDTTSEINYKITAPNEKSNEIKAGISFGSSVRGVLHQKERLRILLSKQMNTNDIATFVISYAGIPTDGLIIAKTKYGRRGFFADNWPNRGHNWLPCHEDPADKATVEFIVTAPDHYQVVANGIQIEETSLGNNLKTTHWKEETPVSTKVMVIGVADFAVNLAGIVNDCIPIYSWVYPENKDKGFYDYALAKDILPFFINNVGPYGYKKLANVQSKTRFGGLENANTIFYSENSVSGTRKNEGLIAHEIAHQWFGNMATEKSFGHLWLSEGFATYFSILYFENKYGKDTAATMLKENREKVIAYSRQSTKAVVDTVETDYMNLLNTNSYQKGGWVLHMLRNELGDSVFWRSIKKYYATYAGGIAGTEDLQKVFENVSGNDLSQFFKQWLYTTGQPNLDIHWNYNSQQKEVIVTINQEQVSDFVFPLEITLKYPAGKSEIQKVYVDKRSRIFTFKTSVKPEKVIPDVSTKLLMSYTIKEK